MNWRSGYFTFRTVQTLSIISNKWGDLGPLVREPEPVRALIHLLAERRNDELIGQFWTTSSTKSDRRRFVVVISVLPSHQPFETD
jgi:hypothetical protein